jgi:hypothetical protein
VLSVQRLGQKKPWQVRAGYYSMPAYLTSRKPQMQLAHDHHSLLDFHLEVPGQKELQTVRPVELYKKPLY